MKITEYFVCYGSSSSQLQDAVNKGIANGWQPLGGVAVSVKWLTGEYQNVAENELLYQAMVRITEDVVRPQTTVSVGPPRDNTQDPPQVPEWEILAREFSRAGKTIEAIRVVREHTELGVQAAKDLVMSWEHGK